MADPFSITSGIIAVLQLASSVVQYLNAVKDASHERQRLIAEIGCITGFLYLLKDSAEASKQFSSTNSALNPLFTLNGPLDLFKDALNELRSKLCPTNGGLRKAGKAFLWPFQKSEINSILCRIERQKTVFGLALQNDNNGVTRLMAEKLECIRDDLTSVYTAVRYIESHEIGK